MICSAYEVEGLFIEARDPFAPATVHTSLAVLCKQTAVAHTRAEAPGSFIRSLFDETTASTLMTPTILVAAGHPQNRIILHLHCFAASNSLRPLLESGPHPRLILECVSMTVNFFLGLRLVMHESRQATCSYCSDIDRRRVGANSSDDVLNSAKNVMRYYLFSDPLCPQRLVRLPMPDMQNPGKDCRAALCRQARISDVTQETTTDWTE